MPHGTEFRTYCYADRFEGGTEPAQAIRTVCEEWRDTSALTNDELRELIAEDGIDLLVNCDGQFTAERLALFATAPQVKASLLLYPSRTGLAQVDYQISDAFIDPADSDHASCRSERLIRLPIFVCFRPPANAPEIAPPPSLRTGRITFGSFSVPSKINAAVARVWSAILREIPDSKLILHSYVPGSGECNEMMPDVRSRLLDLFAGNGIDCDRIETIGYLPLREHLELYQRVDVALDPFPYHGFMTTLHALWMGVPVVILPGARRVSRTGLSFLTHAGLPEYIARTEQEYIDIAVTAAGDGRALARTRAALRERVRSSALCDMAAFSASVREAVNAMLAHANS
jgi:predicted O-linked N-acetylglucosamine transferase (SPINDLY family)